MEKISRKKARAIFLSAQGLSGQRFSSAEAVLKHLSYIQIDTISVVERAHHHVVWSRFPKYQNGDLNRLVLARKAFEYWSHAAAYLPIEDYRFSFPLKQRFRDKGKDWLGCSPKLLREVKQRIRAEGPLASKDFKEFRKGQSGWWDWKPAKRALEKMFLTGELEIHSRKGFQKLYDLPERVIPNWNHIERPCPKEFADYLIDRNLQHHGISTIAEMAYLRRGQIRALVANCVHDRVENGELIPVQIDGINEKFFTRPETLNQRLVKSQAKHLLSPFDNAVIQRNKLKNLFDFEYQIECYVPEPKRKFGYFSLPILIQDSFQGRLDAKAHRKENRLELISLHSELDGAERKLEKALISNIEEFARFNNCAESAFLYQSV